MPCIRSLRRRPHLPGSVHSKREASESDVYKVNQWILLVTLLSTAWMTSGLADWAEARCDVYALGEDHTDRVLPCTFAQRQGSITIRRGDDVTHELSPTGDTPGNFRDQHGRTVYRQGGLGDQGLIFRFPDESVYVYWSTSGLEPADRDNPTWPFSTRDYDATALLRCKSAGATEFDTCPAGILRMDDAQASVVAQNRRGEQFTINFMKDYVNATNREVTARMEGDTWILEFADGEVWEVPLAAIEGG